MNDPQGPSGSGQLGDIPYVRLPDPHVLFARRAERFTALAPGHTLSEYLELLARLARAQAVAYQAIFTGHGEPVETRPVLDVITHARAPEWRDALRTILKELSTAELPAATRTALQFLDTVAPEELEALADRVLSNAAQGTDLAAGPFVAAALQVYFTALSAKTPAATVPRTREHCPICASLPAAGIVLGDDPLRYLVCSVCATQWHHTRIQCAACGNPKDIAYFALEGERAASVSAPSAVKAEACPACKAYTKLFYVEKDPRLEPFADDVATLALDLLMAENGWVRYGVNLFLVPGIDAGP